MPDGEALPEPIDLGVLTQSIGYALRRAQLAVFQDFGATFDRLELSPAALSVLVVLDRNPGRRQREVAAALGIQAPNFAILLDRLEARGLAERRRSPSDRRAVALHLTPAGARLLASAQTLLAAHERRVSERLSEAERRTLFDLLTGLA